MDGVLLFIVDHWAPLLLLLVGFALMVAEMYLPGFGLPGTMGGIMLIAGVLLMAETVLEGLLISVILILLLGIALSIVIRSIAKGKVSKSKLVLTDVSTETNPENPLAYYVGKHGVVLTVLRPVGMAEFDGIKLNVVSDGEFIAPDTEVCVDHVQGNRIVVRTLTALERVKGAS